MNRRILLIDADPGFFQTLSDTLSRYAFAIVNEADPDQAILLAGAEAPALLVVGVDEPDKLGFKVFQRCKKGGLAKVPIMLVTSSVSAESFTKHKSLKTHADEYLDKRKLSREDLLAKIDGLIKLGEPLVEDSLDIPLEIDDIQMGDDGDMVLEEEVDADNAGGDFGDDPHSPLSISGAANLVEDAHPAPAAQASRRVDSMVDADIEDAFGGLLGDDYVEPTAEPVAESEPEAILEAAPEAIEDEIAVEADAVPERMGEETIPPPFAEDAESSMIGAPVIDDIAEEIIEEAVPGAIHDGGLSADDDVNEFDNPNEQSTRGPQDLDDDVGERLRGSDRAGVVPIAELEDFQAEEAPVAQASQVDPADERTRIPTGYESSPAIQLDEMDLQPIEETAVGDMPLPETAYEDSAVPEPVAHVNVREAEPEPEPELPLPPIVAEPPPARPKFIESSTGTNVGAPPAPPAPPAPAPAAAPPMRPSGVLNVVDLGLDRIAQDADRDQSGLHDRRELRKINELERQITQLKAEVERTRATAESSRSTGGREGEFLKLRENLLNQQKDLQKAKDEVAMRDRELADVRERLAEIQQVRMTLQATTVELEQKGAADASRVAAAETKERALAAQLATVQQELAAKTLAADNAETVRNQLERDVANERALRASSASDAERSLRVEREQMIARHQGELVTLRTEASAGQETLRAEAAAAQDQALAALRTQLDTEHAAALAAAADAGRREIAIEADAAVTQLEQRQAADIKQREDDHVAALAQKAAEIQRLEDEHAAALAQKTAEITRLGDETMGKIARLTSERDAAIAKAKTDAERATEEARASAERAGEEARASIERATAEARAKAEEARASAERAVEEARASAERATEEARASISSTTAQLHAEHATTVSQLKADHAAELGRLQADASGQVVAASVANDRAVSELRGEIERMKADAQEAAARHTEAFQKASANQAAALAEQASLHNAALAKREKENVAAREAEAAAHAASLAELRAELERQTAAHGIKLDVAKREVEQMIEQHELAKTQLVEQQRRDAEALAAQHRDELAKVAEDKQRAIEDIQRASTDHRAAVEKAAAQHREELSAQKEAADREIAEFSSALQHAKKTIEDATHAHTAEREAADQAHATALSELTAKHERALAVVNGEVVRTKAVGDAEHGRAMAAKEVEHKAALAAKEAELLRSMAEITADRDEMRKGLSGSRDAHKRTEGELATAVQTIADRNSELRSHAQAIAERDQRIAELRKEIETVETENASYQEQVLRAYQKIKTDEAMVARAKKAMAIALTVLDDQGQPKES